MMKGYKLALWHWKSIIIVNCRARGFTILLICSAWQPILSGLQAGCPSPQRKQLKLTNQYLCSKFLNGIIFEVYQLIALFCPWIRTRETVKVLSKEQISQNSTRSMQGTTRIILWFIDSRSCTQHWSFQQILKKQTNKCFTLYISNKALSILIKEDSLMCITYTSAWLVVCTCHSSLIIMTPLNDLQVHVL